MTNNGGGDDPKPTTGIDIVDGSGASIHLDGPLESCYVVNTHIPTAMKILGLQDKVDEIMFYKSSKYDYFHDAGFDNITKDTPLYSTLTNAEYFQSHGVKYIIEPINSSPLSTSVENACRNANITIIKLDCYGDTMIEDMEKLVKIFGSTKEVKAAFDEYLDVRNDVVNAVLSKSKPTDDNLFLCCFMGIQAFYNKTAEVSRTIESVYGKNALTEIGASTNSATNKASEDGLYERLVELDAKKSINLLILRASGDDQADTLLAKWNKNAVNKYKLSYIDGTDSNVFVIDSDLLSGPMDYIAYVSLGEIIGIDTGYSVKDLAKQYESKYEFPKKTETYTWNVQFDADGNATAVVDAGIDTRNSAN